MASKKEAKAPEKKPFAYKMVAYPVCTVLAIAIFIIEFFIIIPVINHYALVVFGTSAEQLLTYYPTFICFDLMTAAGSIWLSFSLINGITGFCKKHMTRKD